MLFTKFTLCVVMLTTSLAVATDVPWGIGLERCSSEEEFLSMLQQHNYLKGQEKCCGPWIDESTVRDAMHKGWFDATLKMVEACTHVEKKIDGGVHQAASKLRARISEVTHLLQTAKQKVQAIAPAFQWAQSPDAVFISVKFAHKLDAPACIDLQEDKLDFSPNGVLMQYTCKGKNKMYEFDIELFEEIDPSNSTWSMASVGRGTLTLGKKVGGQRWSRLLKSKDDKPRNMHTWWAMQERYETEMANIESSKKENEEKVVDTDEKKILKENEESKPELSEDELEKARQIKKVKSTHKSEKKKITKRKKKALKAIDARLKSELKELQEKFDKDKKEVESKFETEKRDTESKFDEELETVKKNHDEALKAIESFTPSEGNSLASRFQGLYDSISSLLFKKDEKVETTEESNTETEAADEVQNEKEL